jgi:5-methylcytosine-specific restriction endonuclease McrA
MGLVKSSLLIVLLEQNLACHKCNITEWLGEPITLELEHIDGNRHNNTRENLEGLCPNCHSLTPTWRGRNNKLSTRQKRLNDLVVMKNKL